MITLSILICAIPSHLVMLEELLNHLIAQCGEKIFEENLSGIVKRRTLRFESVEIIIAYDNKNVTTGAKRNLLSGLATGKYLIAIDADDWVPDYYIEEILLAAKEDADCIGINGTITTNGENEKKWYISKEYGYWYTKDNEYFRTPNHISPIKREIAIQVPYPNVTFGEDSEFSKNILPLLHTETIIERPLYFYRFSTNKK